MAKLLLVAESATAVFVGTLTASAEDNPVLLKQAQEIFRPLPKAVAAPALPSTETRVELGRMLFFDPRLTIDANMSCSSRHQAALYGTDAPEAIGVQQRLTPRDAPTVLNAALNIIHWRGIE